MRGFYQPFALGSACLSPTEPNTEKFSDGADTVKIGGTSKAPSAEQSTCPADSHESAEHAEASDAQRDVWRLDGKPVLGHRVVRSAVLESLDLHLVLSAGEDEDAGPVSFEIPESVLRWLLTGER